MSRFCLLMEVRDIALDDADSVDDAVAVLKAAFPTTTVPSGEYLLVDTNYPPSNQTTAVSVVGKISYRTAEVAIITR